MEEKITNIITKLNLFDNKKKSLPYKVSVDKISSISESELKINDIKIDEMTTNINRLVQKINNETIYTNELEQKDITEENMRKLKEYYNVIIFELKSYTIEKSELKKVRSKDSDASSGDYILMFYEIINTLGTYNKYYLAYLLSNVLSLNIFFKLYVKLKSNRFITDKYIDDAINEIFNGSFFDINYDKTDIDANTEYNILRFIKTNLSDGSITLTNNEFEINLKIYSEKDTAEPYNNSNCESQGYLKIPVFTESYDYNYKKINILSKYDNKIIVNDFLFQINYYGCVAIFGVPTPARRQFILFNKKLGKKLKFNNLYEEFNYLNE